MNNEIHFHIHGNGHPIIFIHSLGLDHNLWNFCIEELSAVTQTLTYDLPGHGINPSPKNPYKIENLSSDLIKALKKNNISKANQYYLQAFECSDATFENKLEIISLFLNN